MFSQILTSNRSYLPNIDTMFILSVHIDVYTSRINSLTQSGVEVFKKNMELTPSYSSLHFVIYSRINFPNPDPAPFQSTLSVTSHQMLQPLLVTFRVFKQFTNHVYATKRKHPAIWHFQNQISTPQAEGNPPLIE